MLTRWCFAVAIVLVPFAGCNDDDDSQPVGEHAGSSCASPAECYPQIDGAALQGGEVVCMDRVPGGYCTHHCTTDADCCAVPGECRTEVTQVCGPFESTGEMFCFLSCEAADVQWSGLDASAYCQTYAHPSFGCRSTGGGSANRQVCVP